MLFINDRFDILQSTVLPIQTNDLVVRSCKKLFPVSLSLFLKAN